MKFSLNYQQNFIYAILKKMTVKYLFEYKTIIKKEIFKNHSNCFLERLNNRCDTGAHALKKKSIKKW